MAPADVPEIASMRSHDDSSSKRSSTPHVKAPCEPPPCRARSISRGLAISVRDGLSVEWPDLGSGRGHSMFRVATYPRCRALRLVSIEALRRRSETSDAKLGVGPAQRLG